MAMPKGFKCSDGYATTTELGGKSYQQIADIMTERGFKMNHSTSRNVFVNGMTKIVKSVLETQGVTLSDKDIIRVAKNPRFQEGVSEIISDSSGIDL